MKIIRPINEFLVNTGLFSLFRSEGFIAVCVGAYLYTLVYLLYYMTLLTPWAIILSFTAWCVGHYFGIQNEGRFKKSDVFLF